MARIRIYIETTAYEVEVIEEISEGRLAADPQTTLKNALSWASAKAVKFIEAV